MSLLKRLGLEGVIALPLIATLTFATPSLADHTTNAYKEYEKKVSTEALSDYNYIIGSYLEQQGIGASKNDMFKAKDFFRHAIEHLSRVDESNLEAKFTTAECTLNLGNYEDAIRLARSVLSRVKEDDPLHTRANNIVAYAHTGLALMYYKEGFIPRAIYEIGEALKLKPDEPVILYNATAIHRASGNLELSLGYINKAIEMALSYLKGGMELKLGYATNPYEMELIAIRSYFTKSDILLSMNRLEQALEPLDRIIELNPNVLNPYYRKSEILFNLDRYDETIAELDRAIAINPGIPEAYIRKGKVFFWTKDYDAALKAFDEAVGIAKEKRDIDEANLVKAEIYVVQKRYDEAMPLLNGITTPDLFDKVEGLRLEIGYKKNQQ